MVIVLALCSYTRGGQTRNHKRETINGFLVFRVEGLMVIVLALCSYTRGGQTRNHKRETRNEKRETINGSLVYRVVGRGFIAKERQFRV